MPGSNHEIKAVIFDVGGVLLRTEQNESRQQLADQLGVDLPTLYREVFDSDVSRRATVGEVTEDAVWQYVSERFQLNQETLDEFKRLFWKGDQIDTDLVDYIRSLRRRLKTGLLSNCWSGMRPLLGDQYQILDAFDVLVFSSEACLAKPDPQIYAHILKELDVKPAEAVFVDDFLINIEAAQKFGLHAIHFKNRADTITAVNNLVGQVR